MRKPKYAVNDEVYIFMTFDAFTEQTKLNPKQIMFLARGKVLKLPKEDEQYLIKMEHIYLDFTPYFNNGKTSLFKIGFPHSFHWLWIEKGEEAFKMFDNPSIRWMKRNEKSK